jgi:hypothetical protein
MSYYTLDFMPQICEKATTKPILEDEIKLLARVNHRKYGASCNSSQFFEFIHKS